MTMMSCNGMLVLECSVWIEIYWQPHKGNVYGTAATEIKTLIFPIVSYNL